MPVSACFALRWVTFGVVCCQLAARLMVSWAWFCCRRKTVEDTVHWNELEIDVTFYGQSQEFADWRCISLCVRQSTIIPPPQISQFKCRTKHNANSTGQNTQKIRQTLACKRAKCESAKCESAICKSHYTVCHSHHITLHI